MIYVRGHDFSIMILYAIALHFTWATILPFDHVATNATAVNALARYIHPPELLSGVLVFAALAAMLALATRLPWVVILLLPQQLLLMMSAAGAVEAMWLAQFADGVVRARAFIAADQIYSVLAAIGHTAAIIVHALRVDR